jgi:hypothetical protein
MDLWYILAAISIPVVLILTIAVMAGWIGGDRKPPRDDQ